MNCRFEEHRLYIGVNYHPHDWPEERWEKDIALMKKSGFNVIRLGHLCWDSFEPEEGRFEFEWFDRVMDLCAEAGLGVVLDLAARPAPVWVHRLCPGCDIGAKSGRPVPAVRRYMEDVADPDYQRYALRFAEKLASRYREHPALMAFGLCNEQGSGYPSFSEASRKRFQRWLEKKYGTVEALNRTWAAQRWSRRLQSFDDVVFPENEVDSGMPEARLDMRRFFSDGIGSFLTQMRKTVEACAPGIPHSSNHYSGHRELGFDLMKWAGGFVDYPGIGHYPGFEMNDKAHYANMILRERLGEQEKPIWGLEFQSGWHGVFDGPRGWLYSQAMLSLLFRNQMVAGWTWRSMLNGEEEFLGGLLGHDGYPTPNLTEYQRIAADFARLEATGLFPVRSDARIAVAFSQESMWEMGLHPMHFRQPYTEAVLQAHKALFRLNMDYNMVSLAELKKSYGLLIIPGHAVMEKRAAEAVRGFAETGGTVVMTGYSAVTDETGRAFDSPCPGGLTEVFGLRVAGFSRAGMPGPDGTRVPKEREIRFFGEAGRKHPEHTKGQERFSDEPIRASLEYTERLELRGAECLAAFENGEPAVTVHSWGRGRAVYLAAESSQPVLERILRMYLPCPEVPEGVQRREIGPGAEFFVNLTAREITVPVREGGQGVLSGTICGEKIVLPPFGAELVIRQKQSFRRETGGTSAPGAGSNDRYMKQDRA